MKRIDLASLTTKDSPLPWLSANETAALQHYCDELQRAVSREHIKSVILYGSKARGDAHPYSDLDLLVILDPGDEAQRQAEMRVDSAVACDYAVPLESFVLSAQEAAERQQLGLPLLHNVAHDGIVLLGEEFTVNPMDQKRYVQEYMASAREQLRGAKVLLTEGIYRRSISTGYYACLDAADAALIAVGITPRSHEGTRSLFSEHFIKTKRLAEHYKDVFQQMQQARLSADDQRGAHVTRDEAEAAYTRSEDFVAAIEKLLPTLLPDWDKS
jgi:uncharacterized protein (UPF0332 family)/predicted nucleotidyltransferase